MTRPSAVPCHKQYETDMCESQRKEQPYDRRQPAHRYNTLVDSLDNERSPLHEPEGMGKHDDAEKERGNPRLGMEGNSPRALERERERHNKHQQDQPDIA